MAVWRLAPAALATLAVASAAGAKPANRRRPTPAGPPPLAIARKLHTATALSDGRVLVVGGMRGGRDLRTVASAELFDPASGGWEAAGRLTTSRNRHTATLLASGEVLVAGGQHFDARRSRWVMAPSELWDPREDRFAPAGDMITPRSGHTAVRLDDGRVLVAGGSADIGDAPTAELWDPRSQSWRRTGALVRPRILHTMVPVGGGGAVVIGGMSNDFVTRGTGAAAYRTQTHDVLDTIEAWEPRRARWWVAATLNTPRTSASVAVLDDGRILVAGGSDLRGFLAATEICDLTTATCTPTGDLAVPRADFDLIELPGGDVAAVGGETGSAKAPDQVKLIEVWSASTGEWRSAVSLRRARHEHTATLLTSGEILVTGGSGCGRGCENTLATAELVRP